jgi:hypothetical protein
MKQGFTSAKFRKLTRSIPFSWHFLLARGHSGGLLLGTMEEIFLGVSMDQGRFFVVW